MHTHEHPAPHAAESPEQRRAQQRRVRSALAVTGTVFVIEVIGGLLSGSLALLADAAHMFTDLAALGLSYAAMTLADRRPSQQYTFGLYRAEILAAFVNAELLLLVAGGILFSAYGRWQQPPDISTDVMLLVGGVGLAANMVSLILLHGGQHGSLNVRAAYLEVFTDSISSAAVVASACMMAYTGWWWLDPVLSVGIGMFILPRTVSILRQSAHILLEGTPTHINVTALRDAISTIPNVKGVHDMHFWTLTSGVDYASVHVSCTATVSSEDIRTVVEQVFRDIAGIQHVTVQIETTPTPDDTATAPSCQIDCRPEG